MVIIKNNYLKNNVQINFDNLFYYVLVKETLNKKVSKIKSV